MVPDITPDEFILNPVGIDPDATEYPVIVPVNVVAATVVLKEPVLAVLGPNWPEDVDQTGAGIKIDIENALSAKFPALSVALRVKLTDVAELYELLTVPEITPKFDNVKFNGKLPEINEYSIELLASASVAITEMFALVLISTTAICPEAVCHAGNTPQSIQSNLVNVPLDWIIFTSSGS